LTGGGESRTVAAGMSSMEIGQLAAASGVTRRTIRYYVAIGLLPPGEGTGPRRFFSEVHLHRLAVIRQLKDQFLPLDEIKRRMDGWSEYTITEMAQTEASVSAPPAMPHFAPSHRVLRAPLMSSRDPDDLPYPARHMVREESVEPKEKEAATSWKRLELAPGLELSLSENASSSARRLYERIRRFAQPQNSSGYREPEATDQP